MALGEIQLSAKDLNLGLGLGPIQKDPEPTRKTDIYGKFPFSKGPFLCTLIWFNLLLVRISSALTLKHKHARKYLLCYVPYKTIHVQCCIYLMIKSSLVK